MTKKFMAAAKKILHEKKEIYDSIAREEFPRQKIVAKR